MGKSLEEHYGYLRDAVKIRQYRAAIDQVVRPDHVVLDLGCGSGLLGMLALRAGARKVYFLEEEAIIEAARHTAAAEGFADRAEYFQGNSFELKLPELVDIVICDHIGYFGFDYGALALLADARKRFLKPGGIVIPAGVELMLAPIESEPCRSIVGRWLDGSIPEEFSWLGSVAANTKHPVNLCTTDLLAEAASMTTLELGAEISPFLSWNTKFEAARDGVLDGLAGWFDCQLLGNTFMTNAPGAIDALHRPQAFLPLEKPVKVAAGERIEAIVMARPEDYVIAWIIELPNSDQRFELTTFNGQLLDNNALLRTRPDRVAQLNARGRARQAVLSYCDGQRTVAEVQALVQQNHPTLFPSESGSAAFVTRALSKDTSE